MRYEFTPHPSKIGWYRVTDTKWMFTCEFREHEFNETQTFSGLERIGADPEKISRAMSELGDWLHRHHYSEVFPVPKYELRQGEDDEYYEIIRHRPPELVVTFRSGEDFRKVARTLRSTAEWIDKILLGRRNEQE